MYGVTLLKIERPINFKMSKIVLLPKEIFEKILKEKYLKVLLSENRKEYSKSYYYYILDFLKKIGLIIDNSLAFTLALSVIVNEKGILFGNELIYVDKENKLLIIKTYSNWSCETCPLIAECEFSLKRISQHFDIKLNGQDLCDKWHNLSSEIIRSMIKKLNKTALLSI